MNLLACAVSSTNTMRNPENVSKQKKQKRITCHMSPVTCLLSLAWQEASGKPKHFGSRRSIVAKLKLINIVFKKNMHIAVTFEPIMEF